LADGPTKLTPWGILLQEVNEDYGRQAEGRRELEERGNSPRLYLVAQV